MSAEALITIIGGSIVVVTLTATLFRKVPKRLKSAHYIRKWREIQKLCRDKNDWTHAIIHADMLLDEVLVKKRTNGNTMGERMVAAQNSFTSNDKVWGAHKLAVGLKANGGVRVKESVVKDALITFRQALRDLGAL